MSKKNPNYEGIPNQSDMAYSILEFLKSWEIKADFRADQILKYDLTEEQLQVRTPGGPKTPNGANYFKNQIGWSFDCLKRHGLVEVRDLSTPKFKSRKEYRTTKRGNQLLQEIGKDDFPAYYRKILMRTPSEDSSSEIPKIQFQVESQLQGYLVDNFKREFPNWEYRGHEVDAGKAGRIDILAYDIPTRTWIVIELKSHTDSDKVIGQCMRYMGYVQENLCGDNESVKGLIIVGERDEHLSFALIASPNISAKVYSFSFDLKEYPLRDE